MNVLNYQNWNPEILDQPNNIINLDKYNGRVDIMEPTDPNMMFKMQERIALKNKATSYCEAMNYTWEDNVLSQVFFSAKNIQIIQNTLRAEVHRLSDGQYNIGQQDNDQLKIIMRALYLESAVNLPNNVREQVAALNRFVVAHCVPKLMNEIKAYLKYKRDASSMYTLMTWPTYDNVKGKTLELNPWF
jgi:hypothetical protein